MMKCPKCGSENTHKSGVASRRWKIGQQYCGDCDYQADWLDFCPNINESIKQRAKELTKPLHDFFEELEISSGKEEKK